MTTGAHFNCWSCKQASGFGKQKQVAILELKLPWLASNDAFDMTSERRDYFCEACGAANTVTRSKGEWIGIDNGR